MSIDNKILTYVAKKIVTEFKRHGYDIHNVKDIDNYPESIHAKLYPIKLVKDALANERKMLSLKQ